MTRTSKEVISTLIIVLAVMAIQGRMHDNDAGVLAIAHKAEIDSLTGNMDCIFTGYEFPHTWENACYVGLNGVEVRK